MKTFIGGLIILGAIAIIVPMIHGIVGVACGAWILGGVIEALS